MKYFHGTRNFIRINRLADVINDVIQKYKNLTSQYEYISIISTVKF